MLKQYTLLRPREITAMTKKYGDEEETYDDEYADDDTSASDGEGYDNDDEEEPEYPLSKKYSH